MKLPRKESAPIHKRVKRITEERRDSMTAIAYGDVSTDPRMKSRLSLGSAAMQQIRLSEWFAKKEAGS